MVSAVTHGLLLGLLGISPAFLPAEETETLQVIDLVNVDLDGPVTDELVSSGGNPNPGATEIKPIEPAASPVSTQQAQEKPTVVPPPPDPEPVKPKPEPPKKSEPTPKKSEQAPKKSEQKSDPETTPKTKSKDTESLPKAKDGQLPSGESNSKPKIQPSFTKAANTSNGKSSNKDKNAKGSDEGDDSKAQAEAAERAAAAAAYRSKLEAIGRNLGSGLSGGTKISMPGGGAGFFNHYGSVIQSLYERAWNTAGLPDTSSTVTVEIIINRSGRIISAKIVDRSGNAALDRSVQRAIDSVRQAPAFPEGAEDNQRSFKIDFNLNSRRRNG